MQCTYSQHSNIRKIKGEAKMYVYIYGFGALNTSSIMNMINEMTQVVAEYVDDDDNWYENTKKIQIHFCTNNRKRNINGNETANASRNSWLCKKLAAIPLSLVINVVKYMKKRLFVCTNNSEISNALSDKTIRTKLQSGVQKRNYEIKTKTKPYAWLLHYRINRSWPKYLAPLTFSYFGKKCYNIILLIYVWNTITYVYAVLSMCECTQYAPYSVWYRCTK